MTSVLDDNVFNIAVEGTFDDCQAIVKELFLDEPLKERYALTAVNSINWARILAQIVYYFFAAFRVMDEEDTSSVSFSVPTGNFGDVFSGYMAAAMGLPVERLILATNENDILSRFFNTGTYAKGLVHATITPSMDIQVASNFERYLYYRVGQDSARVSAMMAGFASDGTLSVEPGPSGCVDDLFRAGSSDMASTLAEIRSFYSEYGYVLDPHTAVGVHVGRLFAPDGIPVICLATAHPSKFGATIRKALGEDPARHPVIDELADLPTRVQVLPASVDAVRSYVEQRIGESSERDT